jgi:hypothetical protein
VSYGDGETAYEEGSPVRRGGQVEQALDELDEALHMLGALVEEAHGKLGPACAPRSRAPSTRTPEGHSRRCAGPRSSPTVSSPPAPEPGPSSDPSASCSNASTCSTLGDPRPGALGRL